MTVTDLDTKAKTKEIRNDINLYESLYAISEKMMIAAKKEEWNAIITHEIKHQEIYKLLKGLARNQFLEERDLQQKADLIRKIMEVDRQTQGLIKNRIKKLQKGIEEERKITQAYKSATQLGS